MANAASLISSTSASWMSCNELLACSVESAWGGKTGHDMDVFNFPSLLFFLTLFRSIFKSLSSFTSSPSACSSSGRLDRIRLRNDKKSYVDVVSLLSTKGFEWLGVWWFFSFPLELFLVDSLESIAFSFEMGKFKKKKKWIKKQKSKRLNKIWKKKK